MVVTFDKTTLPNNCLTLLNISWKKFQQIETTFARIEGVRFVYLDDVLEIMILGTEHKYYKWTISLLLDAYLRAKKIRFYSCGSATLGSKGITGRKEPDESYNIHAKKDIPDLVIEVIVTSGNIDVLEIYRRIGIPEVWFYQDTVLSIFTLKDNQYSKVNCSQLLPGLKINALAKYITFADQYDAVTEFVEELKCHSNE